MYLLFLNYIYVHKTEVVFKYRIWSWPQTNQKFQHPVHAFNWHQTFRFESNFIHVEGNGWVKWEITISCHSVSLLLKNNGKEERKKVNEGSAHVIHLNLKEDFISVYRRKVYLTQKSALLPIMVNYVSELRKREILFSSLPLTLTATLSSRKKKIKIHRHLPIATKIRFHNRIPISSKLGILCGQEK